MEEGAAGSSSAAAPVAHAEAAGAGAAAAVEAAAAAAAAAVSASFSASASASSAAAALGGAQAALPPAPALSEAIPFLRGKIVAGDADVKQQRMVWSGEWSMAETDKVSWRRRCGGGRAGGGGWPPLRTPSRPCQCSRLRTA